MFIDSALHGGLQRDLLLIATAFLAASLGAVLEREPDAG
jgi:hypothetical protein